MSQNDNLARQTYMSVPLTTPQPRRVPKPDATPIHKARPLRRKVGLTLLEKTVIGLFSVGVCGLSILNISAGVEVSGLNQNEQDLLQKAEQVQVVNANFEQQIQELSRYDRIYTIAQQFGLIENDQNVRNVSK